MTHFSGKQALVTGAGSGIGAALSRALVAAGADVVCTDVDADAAERTAHVSTGPGTATSGRLDVTDAAAVQAAVDDVVSRTGRLDLMFNNAGIVWGGDTELLTLDQRLAPPVPDGVLVRRSVAGADEQPSLRTDPDRDVRREHVDQPLREVDGALRAVLGCPDLPRVAGPLLDLTRDGEGAPQEVDVVELHGHRLTENSPANAHSPISGRNHAGAAARIPPTSAGEGIVIAASARRLRGSAIPSVGSEPIVLSRCAALNTLRTLLKRVNTVPGARPLVVIVLIQLSIWLRRADFSGRSPNVADPQANCIASVVLGTHT